MATNLKTYNFASAIAFVLLFLCACVSETRHPENPWGESKADSVGVVSTFSQMLNNGEMILLTQSGPDTYYEYRGQGMGTQYLLCQRFAANLGVRLRVEITADTALMHQRLDSGDADIAVYNAKYIMQNAELKEAFDEWYKPSILEEIKAEERILGSGPAVKRRVFSPMLDSGKGRISHYDHLFRKHAPTAGLDWRLLAAQCYQESCFDPEARSWAGACGLMQLMPATAAELGIAQSDIFKPEINIEGAVRYIAQLNVTFNDIRNSHERLKFVLAAYNGGALHIRDAMALAEKNGKNANRWADVRECVLHLREPEYYNDAVVKNGYMRGDETTGYVDDVLARYATYKGNGATTRGEASSDPSSFTPHPSTKEHRFSK